MPALRRKVVELKSQLEITYQRPTPSVITQADLAELAELRRQKREVDRQLRAKRFMIKSGLENGAQVEPGPRSAKILTNLIA